MNISFRGGGRGGAKGTLADDTSCRRLGLERRQNQQCEFVWELAIMPGFVFPESAALVLSVFPPKTSVSHSCTSIPVVFLRGEELRRDGCGNSLAKAL